MGKKLGEGKRVQQTSKKDRLGGKKREQIFCHQNLTPSGRQKGPRGWECTEKVN